MKLYSKAVTDEGNEVSEVDDDDDDDVYLTAILSCSDKHCKPKIKCCTVKELTLDEVSKYVNIMHTWRLIDWL